MRARFSRLSVFLSVAVSLTAAPAPREDLNVLTRWPRFTDPGHLLHPEQLNPPRAPFAPL